MSFVMQHRGTLRVAEGAVRLDLEVVRYDSAYPLQLAHDFPDKLWGQIGGLLDGAKAEIASAPSAGM